MATKSATTVRLRNTRPIDRQRGFAGPLQIGRNPEILLEVGEVREYPAVVLENSTVKVWLDAGWIEVVE